MDIVIVDGARTPIGRFGGTLKDVPATELAAITVRELVNRTGVAPDDIDWVLMGIAAPDGAGEVPARHVALDAGLPVNVTCMTFSAACTSALFAANTAFRMIRDGDAKIVIAGGMESMSMNPHLLYGIRWGVGYGDAKLVDGTKLALTDPIEKVQMGVFGDVVAEEKSVTREEMDRWSHISQQRYAKAKEEGKFADEIVPVEVKARKGTITFSEDEHPRPETTPETLAKLRPVFREGGCITAGNAPGINDGAGCVMIMSREEAEKRGLKPLATILSYATFADEPKNIPIVPALTTRKAVEAAGLKVEDIDLFEFNEAFAMVALLAIKMLGIDEEKVNVNGGSIACGHPVGFTGVRILMTLAYELRRRGGGLGVASLCGVGSQGEATVIKV